MSERLPRRLMAMLNRHATGGEIQRRKPTEGEIAVTLSPGMWLESREEMERHVSNTLETPK